MGGVKKKNSKFDYQKNRKRAWKKSKQLPGIEDANVKKAWDMKKSVNQNFKDMGLAFNLSQTFPIPKTKDMMTLAEPGEAIEKSEDTSVKKTKKVKPPPKAFVLEAFEAESKVKRVKRMPLSKPEEQFCTYLIEKHGDNYKAMARDRRNYNQETPAQLRNRIAHYHAAVKSRKQTAPMEEES